MLANKVIYFSCFTSFHYLDRHGSKWDDKIKSQLLEGRPDKAL